MATLSKPATLYPEHVYTTEDTIDFLDRIYSDSSRKEKAFEMIRNSTVRKRHFILPLSKIGDLNGFSERSSIYKKELTHMCYKVTEEAIKNSGLSHNDISMIIVTSCTGFMMPSLTSYLINKLKLPANTIQLPIAQMGCVAGAYAINRAYDYCKNNKKNVLIVCAEASSTCFHKEIDSIENYISNSLFGDGVAAVVMRGDNNCSGLKIKGTQSHILYNSEEYISYDITDQGFNFSLQKDVMHSIPLVSPTISAFREKHSPDGKLDFYISHTGGRRILDEVEKNLSLEKHHLLHSRACLKEHGNTSSVAVIDVLKRHFNCREGGESGLLVAFGPGFTTEMAYGVWV
jgi:type III polyketide synthase